MILRLKDNNNNNWILLIDRGGDRFAGQEVYLEGSFVDYSAAGPKNLIFRY